MYQPDDFCVWYGVACKSGALQIPVWNDGRGPRNLEGLSDFVGWLWDGTCVRANSPLEAERVLDRLTAYRMVKAASDGYSTDKVSISVCGLRSRPNGVPVAYRFAFDMDGENDITVQMHEICVITDTIPSAKLSVGTVGAIDGSTVRVDYNADPSEVAGAVLYCPAQVVVGQPVFFCEAALPAIDWYAMLDQIRETRDDHARFHAVNALRREYVKSPNAKMWGSLEHELKKLLPRRDDYNDAALNRLLRLYFA